jgi:hypothetical protein
MSTIHEAFEATYQRSAEDPSSAEMLAVFTDGFNAAKDAGSILSTICYEFEALLPRHVAHVHSSGGFCQDHQVKATVWPVNLYTETQMREMFDAATERAAKLCDKFGVTQHMLLMSGEMKAGELRACKAVLGGVAAAIRAKGGEGC